MGKKSSSAAKERRAAQRAADREQQQRHEAFVAVFDSAVLADYRAAVEAAIPQMSKSMAAKAVDVVCHRVSAAFSDEYNEKTLSQLQDDINDSLGKEVVRDIYSTTYKMPYSIIWEAIDGVNDANAKANNEARAAKKAAESEGAGPPEPEVVLLATLEQNKEEVGPNALGPKVQTSTVHQQVGPPTQGPLVQEQEGTPELELGGKTKLSKPRSLKIVDEAMWASAQQLSMDETAKQYGIPGGIELYYSNMCRVGQQALAEVINVKTQSIYDARCAQKISREKRKCLPVVAA